MKHDIRLKVNGQSDWQLIPVVQRKASFEISVGNPRCTEDFLLCQVRWARSRFSSFTFSLGDMLNLYDYVIIGHPHWGKLDEAKAWEVCRDEGDSWLEDNLPMIRREIGQAEFTVMRWAQWLSIPEVQNNLDEMWDIYHKNEMVRNVIRYDVEAYVRRSVGQIDLRPSEWERLSSHLLEELSVYKYQTETSRAVSLYPGSNPVILSPKSQVANLLPAVLRERQFVLFEIRAASARSRS